MPIPHVSQFLAEQMERTQERKRAAGFDHNLTPEVAILERLRGVPPEAAHNETKETQTAMTMLLKKSDTLGGMPTLKVRDALLKAFRYEDPITRKNNLLLPPEVIQHLLEQDFLRDLDDGYEATDKGRSLAQARIGQTIPRAKADGIVQALIERVNAINAENALLHHVTHLAVFGSYLSDKPELGDVDVSYRDEPRRRVTLGERYAYLSESNCSQGGLKAALFWPMRQVATRVKNRDRLLRIEPWDSFSQLRQDKGIPFRLLLGNPATIDQP